MNFRTKNEPTGAVYGFINTLLSIINEFKPDYMAAAFDVKRSSLKRTEIYSDYKSNSGDDEICYSLEDGVLTILGKRE